MAPRRKDTPQEVRPGDTFAVPLPDGRYGAVRVIRTSVDEGEPTALIALTPWLGERLPQVGDPTLRETLKQNRTRFAGKPALCWYAGSPPADFVHIGIIEPSAQDLRTDPQGAYCGSWSPAMINPVFWERGEQPPATATHRKSQETRRDQVEGTIDESRFWEAISRLDWNAENEDEIVQPAVEYLAQRSTSEIAGFQTRLAEKLAVLDGEKFARGLGAYAYGGDAFSPDHFLYVRAAVVANGSGFFEQVLADPRRMPKDREFERLLTIAEEAYRRKTGRTPEFLGVRAYETFSNRSGWTGSAQNDGSQPD